MGQNFEINGAYPTDLSAAEGDSPSAFETDADDVRSREITNPQLMQSALRLLLKRCQITGFLVDDQHQLVAVYHDALGLFETELSQNIASLLPASLGPSVGALLQQAKTADESCCEHSQELPACGFILTAGRHHIDAKEFFTVFIERGEIGAKDETSKEKLASALADNRYLRAQILAQEKNEQELAQQTRALARSNADLEEFAYVVSHDLQEPLRAMTAFSQLLQQRYEQHLDTAAKRYIKHIVDGGIRMKAMIDGILELSRINSHQQQSGAVPTELKQAVDMALENLNITCLETQSTITQSVLPTLYIDKNHMVQLFQNLISNAIKFRGDAPPRVHISAKPQSEKWLFMVQDNGMGVPHSQQKRIFKLFQRLHNEQEQKGYGIGLAICKKIVEHYQGDIWLESSPGEGSTVYFTLMVDICPRKA